MPSPRPSPRARGDVRSPASGRGRTARAIGAMAGVHGAISALLWTPARDREVAETNFSCDCGLVAATATYEAPVSIVVKALVFDVFGTLVDWRSSIAREAEAILRPFGYTFDWTAFADAWRAQYQPSMEEVRAGRLPFSKLDVLHRRNLEQIL